MASTVRSEYIQTVRVRQLPRLRSGNPVSEAVVLLCLTVMFVFETGIRNGELNQVFYLLHGIRMANPALLGRDWYTAQSMSYHNWWDLLIAGLVKANLLEVGLTVGTVIVAGATVMFVYLGMQALYPAPGLACCIALMLFGGLFTRGLGDWSLLATSMEPFSISGVALVGGLAFLAHERPFWSGIFLGLSAFLHPHFAVLILAVVAVASLPLYLAKGPRYCLILLSPFALLAAPTLWRVYIFASAPGGNEALSILSGVGPQHYFPWRVSLTPCLMLISALAFGVAGIGIVKPRWNAALSIMVGAIIVVVGTSLLVCSIGLSATLERLLAWRLSSVILLAALVTGSAGLARGWQSEPWAKRASAFWWLVAYLALGGLAACGTARMRWAVLVAATLPFIEFWMRGLLSGPSKATVLALAMVVVGIGPVAATELPKSHLNIRPIDTSRNDIYAWIRSNSLQDSLWLVPLDWKDFCLNTTRAVVVDWSGTPFFPADVIEWHSRMSSLSGITDIRSLAQVSAAYDKMDCNRIAYLQKTYRVDYVVRKSSATLACGVQVFRDSRFAVWKLGSQ